MSYQIINNQEEWEKFFWYAKWYKSKKKPIPSPIHYPCLAKMENCGGGICGDWMRHSVAYPPLSSQLKGKKPIELLKLFSEYKWQTVQ